MPPSHPPSEIGPTFPGTAADARNPNTQSPPANWREALMALIASRIALIELESKDAVRQSARSAVMIVAAVFCGIFAWALLLAGGVSLIAVTADWPWYLVALGVAALHLLVAFILIKLAKPAAITAFPVTRSEFKKDRQWIENFHPSQKSND